MSKSSVVSFISRDKLELINHSNRNHIIQQDADKSEADFNLLSGSYSCWWSMFVPPVTYGSE